jgi:hypothetical protein
MNKEGLVSLAGYISLFSIARGLGHLIVTQTSSPAYRTRLLMLASSGLWLLYAVLVQVSVVEQAR